MKFTITLDLSDEDRRSLVELIESMGWTYTLSGERPNSRRPRRLFSKEEMQDIFSLTVAGSSAGTIARMRGWKEPAVSAIQHLRTQLSQRVAAEVGYSKPSWLEINEKGSKWGRRS